MFGGEIWEKLENQHATTGEGLRTAAWDARIWWVRPRKEAER